MIVPPKRLGAIYVLTVRDDVDHAQPQRIRQPQWQCERVRLKRQSPEGEFGFSPRRPGAMRLRLWKRGAIPVDSFGYPLGAEPSAEDLGWAFAALIAIVLLAAILVISWLISR